MKSPSSRRAWIEIFEIFQHELCPIVALLAEGVDRNCDGGVYVSYHVPVALLAEGVDRNILDLDTKLGGLESPSSRRAWIEIPLIGAIAHWILVALLAEGVDRNILPKTERT